MVWFQFADIYTRVLTASATDSTSVVHTFIGDGQVQRARVRPRGQSTLPPQWPAAAGPAQELG